MLLSTLSLVRLGVVDQGIIPVDAPFLARQYVMVQEVAPPDGRFLGRLFVTVMVDVFVHLFATETGDVLAEFMLLGPLFGMV